MAAQVAPWALGGGGRISSGRISSGSALRPGRYCRVVRTVEKQLENGDVVQQQESQLFNSIAVRCGNARGKTMHTWWSADEVRTTAKLSLNMQLCASWSPLVDGPVDDDRKPRANAEAVFYLYFIYSMYIYIYAYTYIHMCICISIWI